MHIVMNHDGNVPYLEGQSIGVMAPGVDAKGKPHKVRLYSIASTRHGDFGDGKTVSLSVKRLVYQDADGKEVKGVCSNFLCDAQAGDKVAITGPVGTAMLMPEDPNATIIMLATGTALRPSGRTCAARLQRTTQTLSSLARCGCSWVCRPRPPCSTARSLRT
eukprot:TRINITY_DN10_c0_g2_i1.p3 TRINITY_DN10_c0_g2~~TRINITY_DN10_c0_g2_i1.p3  ORF type:complete len:162 (-),score=36.84 TRINITY_DN10_c0_g2_i1:8-493(-)